MVGGVEMRDVGDWFGVTLVIFPFLNDFGVP